MIRHTLSLAMTVVAACGPALASQKPPPPDTGGTGKAHTLADQQQDQAGDAPWLKRTPFGVGDTAAWYRARIARDLDALDRTSRELRRRAETTGLADRRAVARGASKTAKVSRSLWSDLQFGKSTRPKPNSDARKAPRRSDDAVESIRTLERLAGDVARAVSEQGRMKTLDASAQREILDKLERINDLALWISAETEQ